MLNDWRLSCHLLFPCAFANSAASLILDGENVSSGRCHRTSISTCNICPPKPCSIDLLHFSCSHRKHNIMIGGTQAFDSQTELSDTFNLYAILQSFHLIESTHYYIPKIASQFHSIKLLSQRLCPFQNLSISRRNLITSVQSTHGLKIFPYH
jgi:hypothetical protein